MTTKEKVERVMVLAKFKDPSEIEFHQAVEEVLTSVMPFVERNSQKYDNEKIIERLIEPERSISFRVTWADDSGEVQVNRGYRVQMNSAIGPYKGGLRFHPSVNLSVMKFLAFEQVFKNALTTLPLGGGKGGSDFDPKGKSDREIMRFCQAFMTELARHIGPDTDVPAGDIGVGAREIGYLFGQYKRLKNTFVGTITGKGIKWGGSFIRPEATGYGVIYFVDEMLSHASDSLPGKTVLLSGSGNVAQYVAERAIMEGAKVLTMSDSGGYIFDPDGIDRQKLDWIMDLKNERHGRIDEYVARFQNAKHSKGEKPWGEKGDIAIPAATQNELDLSDAKKLIANGTMLVVEAANMPTTMEAINALQSGGILFGPAKAANAGGVAVSGLEMAQNSLRMSWTRDEVNSKLRDIMKNIHSQCVQHGSNKNGHVNYVDGANIAGFVKVADAMVEQGLT